MYLGFHSREGVLGQVLIKGVQSGRVPLKLSGCGLLIAFHRAG